MTDSPTPRETLEMLRREAARFGVDVVSSARIGPAEREGFHASIREVASSLDRAIVLGCRLSGEVLATIEGAPNWTYYHHYRTVNFALDQAALYCATACRRMGYRALPVPASQMMDWDRLLGHLSHRELGALAGIGWRGRNNLLVHPAFGSQVRYVSVLTDAPLPDRGLDLDEASGCGACRACVGVCPAGAIKMDPLAFDLDRCAARAGGYA